MSLISCNKIRGFEVWFNGIWPTNFGISGDFWWGSIYIYIYRIYIYRYLIIVIKPITIVIIIIGSYEISKVMGLPRIIQVMDDDGLVLKPMVTWGLGIPCFKNPLTIPNIRIFRIYIYNMCVRVFVHISCISYHPEVDGHVGIYWNME